MIEIEIREANTQDLPSMIALLANDPLGAQREDYTTPLNPAYIEAWDKISRNINAEIFVVETQGKVIALAQLNYMYCLTYQGGRRAQIEGVRVHPQYQKMGIGKKLFGVLIKKAREKNCHLVQLTTDISRTNALKFYESIGFEQGHIGMKLHLTINNET